MTQELVAKESSFGDAVGLFTVVRRSASRVYVEPVEDNGVWAHGRQGGKYLHSHEAMTVRDAAHFEAIKRARKEFVTASRDIKATAEDKLRKALARYKEAVK